MPFHIVRNDIAKMQVDAVVNAANTNLLAARDGVCGALFQEAGVESLQRACRKIGNCPAGSAVVTAGFNLTARYIIHAVGPVWHGGQRGEAACLRSCYDHVFALAQAQGIESLAMPLISTGAFGYPRAAALVVALEAVSAFLANSEMNIYLVVYDRDSVQISKTLFSAIQEYIDDTYVESCEHAGTRIPQDSSTFVDFETPRTCALVGEFGDFGLPDKDVQQDDRLKVDPAMHGGIGADRYIQNFEQRQDGEELEGMLDRLDESFSQSLLRLIDEQNLIDAEVYKRANISRKLFSKIRTDSHYRPSKPTVLAFAIALKLSLSETESLLRKAGFALSHSNKFDVIVEYFIVRGNYNIFAINEALFSFDQMLLGA